MLSIEVYSGKKSVDAHKKLDRESSGDTDRRAKTKGKKNSDDRGDRETPMKVIDFDKDGLK